MGSKTATVSEATQHGISLGEHRRGNGERSGKNGGDYGAVGVRFGLLPSSMRESVLVVYDGFAADAL